MNLDLIFESQEVRLACAGYVLLSEAIKISPDDQKKYARYIAKWDKTKYAQWFGDEERIIVPLESSEDDKKINPPPRVEKAMDVLGYKIQDYYAGTCTKDGKNIEKIGRVLKKNESKLKESGFKVETYKGTKDGETIEYQMLDVIHDFDFDRNRGARKDPLVMVISRHPLDLAKMAEDRPWQKSSCMAMDRENHHYVWCDIDEGTLIAYATKKSDRDLENPVGRVLIKPYINIDDPKDIILVNTRMAYGASPAGFMKAIDTWLLSIQGDKKGRFKLNPKLYHDRPEHGHGQGEGVPRVLGAKPDYANFDSTRALTALKTEFSDLDREAKKELERIVATDPYNCIEYFEFLTEMANGGGDTPWDVIGEDVLNAIVSNITVAEDVFALDPAGSPDAVLKAVAGYPEGALWAINILLQEDSESKRVDNNIINTVLAGRDLTLPLRDVLDKYSFPYPIPLIKALRKLGEYP